MMAIDWVSAFAICTAGNLLGALWLAALAATPARGSAGTDHDARTALRTVAAGMGALGLGLAVALAGDAAASPLAVLASAGATAGGLLAIAWGLHRLGRPTGDGGLHPLPTLTPMDPMRSPAQRLGRAAAGAVLAVLAAGACTALLVKGPHAAPAAWLPPAAQAGLALVVGLGPVALMLLAMTRSCGRLRALLHDRSLTDDLTGCLSRRALSDAAPRVVQRARLDGRRAAVLVIDMDRLKSVNDGHGYRAGDAVVSAVASRLRTHLRAEALLVRHGGGTFVLAMAVDDERNARLVAERLRLAVCERPIYLKPEHGTGGGLAIAASISVGLAWALEPAALDLSLAQAEGALARAKRGGRNRVEFAVTAVATPAMARLDSQPAAL